jgi:hypothetical protein
MHRRALLQTYISTTGGAEIEITTTYTYLGVQFTGPRFGMRRPFSLDSVKGTVPWPSSRDSASWVSFRTSRPNSTSWRQLSDPQFSMAPRSGGRACYRQIGPGWRESRPCFSGASSAASGQFRNPLFRQSSVSTHFCLEVIFHLVSFLHRVSLSETLPSGESNTPTSHFAPRRLLLRITPQAVHEVGSQRHLELLQSMTISPERLPPFSFSLDAPHHLLSTRQVLNQAIREDIYRLYIQVTWTSPPTSLGSKMSFYLEHFLELQDGIIVRPPYTCKHWMHSLRIPLGQLQVGSHRLQIETDHHIPRSDRICQMCHLQEPETEMHLIFRCPLYYEIRGHYHCLYRDSGGSLSTFFLYQDQRCLALFIREIFSHRSQFLHTMPHLGMTRTITSYFHVDPSDQSNKRRAESQSAPDSRLVRPRVSPQPPPLGDRSLSSRPVRRCQTVH